MATQAIVAPIGKSIVVERSQNGFIHNNPNPIQKPIMTQIGALIFNLLFFQSVSGTSRYPIHLTPTAATRRR